MYNDTKEKCRGCQEVEVTASSITNGLCSSCYHQQERDMYLADMDAALDDMTI